MKSIALWAVGVPISIIILLNISTFFEGHHPARRRSRSPRRERRLDWCLLYGAGRAKARGRPAGLRGLSHPAAAFRTWRNAAP